MLGLTQKPVQLKKGSLDKDKQCCFFSTRSPRAAINNMGRKERKQRLAFQNILGKMWSGVIDERYN